MYPSSYIDGVYVPNSHDSFYHARRILDAAQGNYTYFSFDARIHAPEGSWLTWPWAYDYLMAQVVRIVTGSFEGISAMSVLARIPPLWILINSALLIWITGLLRIPTILKIVALLCFTASPLTQELHGFAVIDHHYIEYTFVLLTLAAGLQWMRNPSSRRYAAALGVVLGVAPAFHNSLFVLQLPVLGLFAVTWLRRQVFPGFTVVYVFALCLLFSTLIFLLPSEQFQRFQFSYYLHSWFHLYIACATATIIVLLKVFRCTQVRIFYAAILALLLAVPLLIDVWQGLSFISGHTIKSDELYEYKSLFSIVQNGDWRYLTERYSAVVWILPVILLWAVRRLIVTDEADERYYVIYILFGLILMAFQLRMQYFGSFVLYLPVLSIFSKSSESGNPNKSAIVAVILMASYIPGSATLFYDRPLGLVYDYQLTRPIYPSFKKACDDIPGVVLSDHNDGHYIRYHTECSVIANNFALSPQHQEKIAFSDYLLTLTLKEVLTEAPYIRYIYVRRNDNPFEDMSVLRRAQFNKGLRADLLYGDQPDSLELVERLDLKLNGETQPLARLYRVR